ncbi:MAG: DoxX family protein [Rickettsiales bacterium]
MKKQIIRLFSIFFKTTSFLQDFLLLGMRLWIANIFWKSGILKFNDWETTVMLFTDEHPVPYVNSEFAALSGTTFELLCPILLTVGLGSRFATLPLLVITAVIQITYLQHEQHYYWSFLLGTILCFGSGRISADYFIKRKFGNLAKL